MHPALPHRPSGSTWPAMVALVTRDHAMLGVHRTWLARDGSGKAPVPDPKMALGPVGGGAVRLAPAAEKVMVAEGIETGLSVMQATGTPTWAALGTSGLRALQLPPEVREVTICADRDPDGEGKRAADEAAQKWLASTPQCDVRIALPPLGYGDFNDMATAPEAAP
jgi:putative DNA primase/helicase